MCQVIQSRVKLLEIVENLRHECAKNSLHEAWQFCGRHQ